jgi:hypothetical protein
LPRIDQVINSTAGCDLLCFLDCYSGYHQIAIKEEDQEKTAFITPFGAYCYTTMSFMLKNASAMLGNSGKSVTLETLSLTKFLRYVFQEQGTHDFRKPGTCEASDSRICEVWVS